MTAGKGWSSQEGVGEPWSVSQGVPRRRGYVVSKVKDGGLRRVAFGTSVSVALRGAGHVARFGELGNLQGLSMPADGVCCGFWGGAREKLASSGGRLMLRRMSVNDGRSRRDGWGWGKTSQPVRVRGCAGKGVGQGERVGARRGGVVNITSAERSLGWPTG